MIRVVYLAGLATLFALVAPAPALAGGCPGVFVRDSPSYDNRGDSGALERVDVVVPKGTQDLIVGYAVVAGKRYFVQYRAYLHEPADIKLKAGCTLEKYE